MSTLTARGVRPGDFGAIAALTNHFIANTATHFGYEPVTPAELQASWEKTRDKYPYLVAECEGRFAGYAKAGVWRDRAAYSWTAEVGIYLLPEFQGKGFGRRFYATLLSDLEGRGFHSVIGGITLPNDASVRLHTALGFEPVGVVRHAGWKTGSWHDVAFYQKMLRGGDHVPRESDRAIER